MECDIEGRGSGNRKNTAELEDVRRGKMEGERDRDGDSSGSHVTSLSQCLHV